MKQPYALPLNPRKLALPMLGLCLVAALALALVPATPPQPASLSQVAATARISRGTLLDTSTQTGTLGFGDSIAVPFISRSNARSGIVTWLAPEGSIVARGEPLFAIDGQPVVLLYGTLPAFRTLRFDDHSFEVFEWVELNDAQDDKREAELNLEVQQSRLAEAIARRDEARIHVEDGLGKEPVTPLFIRLSQAVTTAADRLRRIEQLSERSFTTTADVQQARYELAMTEADRDASVREWTQRLAAAETAVAEAQVSLLESERALRDAGDTFDALIASANDNADVALLRENLATLGYHGDAAQAIRRWQADAGRSATGLIEPGQVVVAAGPVRVAEHLVDVGDVVFGGRENQPGFASDNNGADLLLRYTGVDRIVTVPLEIADHSYARVGDAVTVTLPTDTVVTGIIADVSAVFNEGVADAEIHIEDQASLGKLEAASVDVEFVVGKREDVLSVPVAALRALPEGGYGVEIIEGDDIRLQPVTTGLFARGQVEISGEEVVEGTIVGIAR